MFLKNTHFDKKIKKIVRNNIKENIFNYGQILENATEIHIMESSIRQILEVLNIKTKKLYHGDNEVMDISSSFTAQKLEFMRAGGSYSIVFGKKLQSFAAKTLKLKAPEVFASNKEVFHKNQGLSAVEKIFNKNSVGTSRKTLHAGSYARVKVNIVGSQDTTGLMTAQELESMAATVISPIIDGAYQSGCHTASVWDLKAQENKQSAFTFNYTYQIPTSDLANTFGDNSAIGASYFLETANNLFYGIEGSYMFGNNVKDATLFDNISTNFSSLRH